MSARSWCPLLLAAGHGVRVMDRLDHGGESLLGIWTHPAFEFRRGDIRDREASPTHARDRRRGPSGGDRWRSGLRPRPRERRARSILTPRKSCWRPAGKPAWGASSSPRPAATTANGDADGYVDENSPLRPVSLYAETKVAIERHSSMPTRTGRGLCATPLRFATVFGVSPRMRFDLTVNEFTAELITRRRLVVFGEQFWRPYVHVRDAARAHPVCSRRRGQRRGRCSTSARPTRTTRSSSWSS